MSGLPSGSSFINFSSCNIPLGEPSLFPTKFKYDCIDFFIVSSENLFSSVFDVLPILLVVFVFEFVFDFISAVVFVVLFSFSVLAVSKLSELFSTPLEFVFCFSVFVII